MNDDVLDVHSIYLIAHRGQERPVGPVKVGFTKHPEKRLAALQTGNPVPIVMVASFLAPSAALARHAEGVFHEVCKINRMSGEWFDKSPANALAALATCISLIIQEDVGNDPEMIAELLDWSGLVKAVSTLQGLRNEGART